MTMAAARKRTKFACKRFLFTARVGKPKRKFGSRQLAAPCYFHPLDHITIEEKNNAITA
jgi:hypothetical protein